jgi:hypothetical protein
VRAVHIGRIWYVDVGALKQYIEVQELEKIVRNRHLQEQRSKEHNLRTAAVIRTKQIVNRQGRLVVYAVMSVCMVIALGFAAGAGIAQLGMVAAVTTVNQAPDAVSTTTDQTVLVPTFTTPHDSVLVAPGREIVSPATEKGWLRVWYD